MICAEYMLFNHSFVVFSIMGVYVYGLDKKKKKKIYLQKQYELWKSLNGFDHQAIKSYSVNTRCLLFLKRENKV